MHRARSSPRPLAAAVALAAVSLLGPLGAWGADAVRVELHTRVAQGQRPRVRLVVRESVESLRVELRRDDGETVSAAFPALGPGASREVLLPGDTGKHRYEGTLAVTQRGATREDTLTFESQVAAPLRVDVDRSRVDLARRQLEVRMTRPAGRVEVKVLGASGDAPIETSHDFSGHPADEPLIVTWPSLPGGEPAARIDLTVYDADGFYVGLAAIPWSVHIPHEEVGFATDSTVITAAEEPKLQKSLALITDALRKHRQIGPIRLFIAGHTDTQATASYNLKLSRRRAQAIAAWFRRHGLRLPIAYEGFGEHALLMATPDETDEPRNRRVDYILAVEEPRLSATSFRATWKPVP